MLTTVTPVQVRYWDLVIGVLLVFTATVTPFEVAYLNPHLDGTYHLLPLLSVGQKVFAVLYIMQDLFVLCMESQDLPCTYLAHMS